MEFDQPLEIYAIPADAPILFATTEAFDEWIEQQIRFWGDLLERVHLVDQQTFPLVRVVQRQYLEWRNMKWGEWRIKEMLRKSDASGFSEFGRLINEHLIGHRLICSSHPMVARAEMVVGRDQDVAACLIAMASDDIEQVLRDTENVPYSLSVYARAIAVLSETHSLARLVSDISKSAVRADAILSQSDAEHSKMRSSADWKMKVLSRASRMAVAAASRQRRAIDDEWGRLRTVYDASLKLRAPREYWETKFQNHQRLSKQWSIAFVCISLFGISVAAGALWLLSKIWEAQSISLGAISWILPATILGIPLFLVLWLLRICGRQWSDHVMRQEDARERVVMIETFLALSRDTDSPNAIVDPGHLAIVLNSVFRPGPGFASDDSPPAGFAEAVLAKLGPQRSG